MKRLREKKGRRTRSRESLYPEFEMTMSMIRDPLARYLEERLSSELTQAFLKGFRDGFKAAEKRRQGKRWND